MKHLRHNVAGMTLLEVLIGVAMLALITSALAQASWLTTKGKRTIEERQLLVHQARVAMQRLVNDLQMAFIVKPVLNPLGRDVSPFKSGFVGRDSGETDSIAFTTLAGRRYVAGLVAADQREMEYLLEPLDPDAPRLTRLPYPDDAKQLVRREDATLDDDLSTGGDKIVLAEGILKLNLEYWDPKEGDFVDEWDSASRITLNLLPRAVKITMTFPNPVNPDGDPVMFQSVALLGMGPDPVEW